MKAFLESPKEHGVNSDQLLDVTAALKRAFVPRWFLSKPVMASVIAAVCIQNAEAGDPVFAPAVIQPFNLRTTPALLNAHTAFVDLDGDGDEDIIRTNLTTFLINKNVGSGTNPLFSNYIVPTRYKFPIIERGTGYPIGSLYAIDFFDFEDFDNDGDFDLFYSVSGCTYSIWGGCLPSFHENYLCYNNGTVTEPVFGDPIARPFGIESSRITDIIDIDEDDDLDVILHTLDYHPYEIYYLKNVGDADTPQFSEETLVSENLQNAFAWYPVFEVSQSIVDWDNDNEVDIVKLGMVVLREPDPNENGCCSIDVGNLPGIVFRNKGLSANAEFDSLELLTIPDFRSLLPDRTTTRLVPTSLYYNPYYQINIVDIDNDGDQDMFLYAASYIHDIITNDWGTLDTNAIFGPYKHMFLENLGNANNTITGICYLDENRNVIPDSGEVGLPDVVINYQRVGDNHSLIAITDENAKYLFPALDGIYTLSALPPNENFTVAPAQATVNTNNPTDIYTRHFAIQPVDTIQDLATNLTSGFARPGFTIPFWLTYRNNGTNKMDGSLELKMDPNMTYIGGTSIPDEQSGNVLTWNFSDLAPLASVVIRADLELSAATPLGDTIMNILTVNPISGDRKPENNTDTLTAVTRGSYDPNDKLVTPSGDGENGNIPPGTDLLEYTIRFQNTGTDTAFNIIVKDSLDGDFDLSTLKILASSHPVSSTTRNGNTLKFTFNNILLPDSTVNEPASHGFVKYSIQPKIGLTLGSQFHNTAAIYFDYNEPILTNTTVNTLFVPTGLADHYNNTYRLFPNPMHTKAVLHFDNISKESYQFKLMDMTGKLLWQTSVENDRVQIERNTLPTGMYLFTLENGSNKSSGKLIVQ